MIGAGGRGPRGAVWLGLGLVAALPLLALVPEGGFLADAGSELPVRLWGHEAFLGAGVLGGRVEGIGAPAAGQSLNNADVVGTIVTAALRPLLGRAGAWDAVVWLATWANLAATWSFARRRTGDAWTAATVAVGVAFSPLLLSYAVASAIVDVLHVWPYPLVLGRLDAVLRGERPGLNGALAGLAAVAGFVACPYTFVVVLPFVLPGLLWAARPLLAAARDPARRRGLLVALAVAVPLGGAIALHTRRLLDAPDSGMPAAYVAATHHAPPFPQLRPDDPQRYAARLSEYVAVGRQALVERDSASHYARTVAVGLVLLGLAGVGAWTSGPARRWLAVAGFAALVSTGPYLLVQGDLALPGPWNPAFLYAFFAVPGGRLLLETFRYGLVVSFGVAMAAGSGVAWLRGRPGILRGVGVAAPFLVVLDVALLSPAPIPLPTTALAPDSAFTQLDTLLPPGPVVELPWFDRGSGRFTRVHFLDQLAHGRPIPDEVRGYPPAYVLDNAFLRALLAAEGGSGHLSVSPPPPEAIGPARARLVADGFVGIVLDPSAYVSGPSLLAAQRILGGFGTRLGGRLVYPIGEPLRPPDGVRPKNMEDQ